MLPGALYQASSVLPHSSFSAHFVKLQSTAFNAKNPQNIAFFRSQGSLAPRPHWCAPGYAAEETLMDLGLLRMRLSRARCQTMHRHCSQEFAGSLCPGPPANHRLQGWLLRGAGVALLISHVPSPSPQAVCAVIRDVICRPTSQPPATLTRDLCRRSRDPRRRACS